MIKSSLPLHFLYLFFDRKNLCIPISMIITSNPGKIKKMGIMNKTVHIIYSVNQ